jgi:D-amino-acid dehydrogenase
MPRTPDTYEALVVGGGLVGLCCALALQDRGMSVAVIDPGDPRARASFGNAGVISRGSILPVAGPGARRALLRYALARDPGVRVGGARSPASLPGSPPSCGPATRPPSSAPPRP